jgi:LacI family transcriptional regulator, galactose operon repressor
MERKATSQDVADLAGVSRSAVSLVLNGRGQGNISAEKQAAILWAAKELDYSPNSVALSLRTRRSSTIGVVTDSTATGAFGGRLIQGASDLAAAHGYLLMVIDTQNDRAAEDRAFETLRGRQVDGFIYAAMSLKPYEPISGLISSAAALANCFDPDDRVPGFVPDEMAGSRAAGQHLIEHGHRDLAMLTGTSDVLASSLREQGFAQALADVGLPTPPAVPAGWEIDKGYAAATHVLTTFDPRPTGLFVANDRAAIGVVLAAAMLGLSVPEDLSVVGYDDDENVAPWLVPALTTVRLPHREMGEAAMRYLLTRIGGEQATEIGPSRVLLECPLVVRDSVAPPGRRRSARRGGGQS